MTQQVPESGAPRAEPSRLHSRVAAGVTGVAVVASSLTYIVWSLAEGRTDRNVEVGEGISLTFCDVDETKLTPPPLTSADETETPLSLDDAVDYEALPVVNAHLEVPLESVPCALETPSESSLRQLSHDHFSTADSRSDQAGVWLNGTIEPAPFYGDSDRTVSRYLRK